MKKDITQLYCFVDDFVTAYKKVSSSCLLGKSNSRKPTRVPNLSEAEIMTIVLLFHQSPCKNFKFFYCSYLPLYRPDFPSLCSYERFVTLMKR